MPDITPLKFTEEQKRLWKATYAATSTPDQWAVFIEECERRALIPNTHVVFSLRNANEYDPITREWVKTKKVAFITTINALRLLVDRYSDKNPDRAFQGYGDTIYYYGQPDTDDMAEKKVPLSGKIPLAVSIQVFRKDWKNPYFATARYDACVQTNSKGEVTPMWTKRGPEQTAKCCEAFALRAIAPEETGQLYLREELESSLTDSPEAPEAPKAAPAPLPVALTVPAVNQAPAPETVFVGVDVPTTQPDIKSDMKPSPAPVTVASVVVKAEPVPDKVAGILHPVFSAAVAPFAPGGMFDTVPQAPTAASAQPARVDAPLPKAVIPPAPVITDDDLPGMMFAEAAPAQLATLATAVVPPVQVAPAPKPVQPVTVASAPSAPVSAPTPPSGDSPATTEQLQTINGRMARLTRDTAPKAGIPERQAGEIVKAYFSRVAGLPYRRIPFSKLVELLVALETASTPEAFAKLVKGA